MTAAVARLTTPAPPTLSRLERLERENEALRYRIEELEGLLGMEAELPAGLPSTVNGKSWGRMTSWRLLGLLIKKKSITREGAVTALYACCADESPDPKNMYVFIHRLRSFLALHGITIDTIWGAGWRLSPEMKAKAIELVRRFNEGEAP